MSRQACILFILLPTLLSGCGWGKLQQNVRGLESDSADVRRESALRLAETHVGKGETRNQLLRRLSVTAQSDPDPLVRSAALSSLVAQDVKTGVEVAASMRTDGNAMVRWDAVRIMARHADAGSVPVFIEIAENDTDENVRREAVKALARFDESRVIRTLIGRLTDTSLSVAHAAHESLKEISHGVDLGMDPDAWKKWLE